MRSITIVRAGGISLIAAALGFVGVFAYLAMQFNYPAVLDGSAAEVLPKLLATGSTGRAVWALYGFLPLLLVPAGVGAYYALRDGHEGSMVVALLFVLLATVSMMLGLLRWPSIHWSLATAQASGGAGEQAAIAAVFAGLNSYLGNYLGEFLGELCLSVFFLLSSLAMLAKPARFPRWVGYLGVITAVAGLIGMFRNVSGVVNPVSALNNYLLPLWMIIFGVALVRDAARERAATDSESFTSHHAPTS
jgi:hypothetical protein